jgi:hypothetical protein
VAEGYCWAITQAAGRSCCDRSDFSVLESEFDLDPRVHTCARVTHILPVCIFGKDKRKTSGECLYRMGLVSQLERTPLTLSSSPSYNPPFSLGAFAKLRISDC